MKIALDARWIFPEISGIGEYTRELVRALAALDEVNEYLLLFHDAAVRARTEREIGITAHPRITAVTLPYGVFSPLSQLLLPRWLHARGIDVFHSPNYMIPLTAFPRRRRGRMACVVTIHDVIPLLFPHAAPRSRKARLFPIYKRLMREIGARADAIITDSDASGRDVMKHLRIPRADALKLHTIPCGVSPRFRLPAPIPPRPAKGPAEERTLLYVGRADPYKNVATLIRALQAAQARTATPLRLCIAGAPDPRYPEAQQLATQLGVANSVTWTGYLPDDRLVALYRGADALVHASRYEGFGLQVAEAMASGTPVICSNAGALPEVAGDAAILLDPDDLDGFSNAILRVVCETETAADMRAKGLRQAARFTWQRAAEKTLAVYRQA